MTHLSLAEQLAARRRDATLAEIVAGSDWDRYVVMQVVLLYGSDHDTWTCNDLRAAGITRRVPVDGLPSTLDSTHGHRLAVWTLTGRGHRLAAERFTGTDVAA